MGEKQYVVIRDMSAGNAETGEAWQETKLFSPDATLREVMEWADPPDKFRDFSRKRITLTVPHND